MDVAGEHDVGGAQPRRRRDDALANAGCIDADDRRVLEDPRPCPPRQRGQAVDIFAAVDLKRLRIIHAVEITVGLELGAHAIDLPALYFGLKILAEHLQAADQPIADIDIGYFQRAFARAQCPASIASVASGPNIFGAFLRQRPEFAGVFEADARDQIADRNAIARHHRAELMAGCIPADVPAFEHGDAGAEPRGLQRHRQPGKPRADHGDVDIQIEGKPRSFAAGRRQISWSHLRPQRSDVALISFSYGPIRRLSPCAGAAACTLMRGLEPNRDAPCAV